MVSLIWASPILKMSFTMPSESPCLSFISFDFVYHRADLFLLCVIRAVPQLPLLVDIDTGFGSAFGIGRTIRGSFGIIRFVISVLVFSSFLSPQIFFVVELMRVGVAAVHIEDQAAEKRCGFVACFVCRLLF
jgi:hypothetical protein